jgi:polyisoprenoid-binding protein YceI
MIRTVAAALVGLLLTSTALAGETATYKLEPAKSWLWVLVKYDRNAWVTGHDHVVRAQDFTGSVTWNPDDPSVCDVKISFPVTALVVDPPGGRERAGLDGTTPDSDKRKIKENFEGPSQLAASKFPEISFQSTKCEPNGDTTKVTGKLSIRGVALDVSADMKVRADSTFSAQGSFVGTHTAWGFDPFSAALGAVKNDNTLRFHVDVAGSR